MKTLLRQVFYAGVLVVCAAVGRYLLVSKGLQPFPNFEVVSVVSFIGVMILDVRIALFIPLIGMICSDLLIGNPVGGGEKMNQIVMFTYSGLVLVAFSGMMVGNRMKPSLSSMKVRSAACMAGCGALLVFVYDLWTNFGWWYLMYPHTGEALATVYALGVPFMVYHLISGMVTFVCIGLPVLSYASTKHPELLSMISGHGLWKRRIPVGVAVLLLMFVSVTGCVSTSVQEQDAVDCINEVSLEISAPTWHLVFCNITTMNVTVAGLLHECADRYPFSVQAEYWPSYGSEFVTSINDIQNGKDGGYWQYYVNGRYATTGCSLCHLHDNDVVEWRFELSHLT